MARSLNKVMLIGHIGNINKKETANGIIFKASLATNYSYKDKDSGEWIKNTDWHNIDFFGKLAFFADSYIKKGSKIFVEGQLKTNKYEGKDGIERYSTSVIVKEVLLLNKKDDEINNDEYEKGDNIGSPNSTYDLDDEPPF